MNLKWIVIDTVYAGVSGFGVRIQCEIILSLRIEF